MMSQLDTVGMTRSACASNEYPRIFVAVCHCEIPQREMVYCSSWLLFFLSQDLHMFTVYGVSSCCVNSSEVLMLRTSIFQSMITKNIENTVQLL